MLTQHKHPLGSCPFSLPAHGHPPLPMHVSVIPSLGRGYPRVSDALRKVDIEAIMFFLGMCTAWQGRVQKEQCHVLCLHACQAPAHIMCSPCTHVQSRACACMCTHMHMHMCLLWLWLWLWVCVGVHVVAHALHACTCSCTTFPIPTAAVCSGTRWLSRPRLAVTVLMYFGSQGLIPPYTFQAFCWQSVR